MVDIPAYMDSWRLVRIDMLLNERMTHMFVPVPYGMETIIIHTAMHLKGSIHEIINHTPMRYYFDCELEPHYRMTTKLVHRYVKLIVTFLRTYDDHWNVFDASGPTKLSLHIYSVAKTTNSFDDIIAVAKALDEHILDKMGTNIVDRGVYKHNASLRMPYSTKTDGTRPLIPFHSEHLTTLGLFISPTYERTIVKKVAREVATVDPSYIPEGLLQQSGILKNIHPWYCPLCDRVHEHDNAMLQQRSDGYYIYCFRKGDAFPAHRPRTCRNLESY